MPIKPNAPVGVCLECGGALKRRDKRWVCVECGETYDPDEVGFTDDMPPNIYRGERVMKNGRGR